MLVKQSCFAVLALAHTVTAFIPWIPDYRCKEFGSCKDERRNVNVRGLEHVEIIQRVAENQLPHDVQVQRLAQRLFQKYQRDSPSNSIGQRDYRIVPAAAPTTPSSAGIDQDGTDFSYFAKVQVGSKGQVMNMALDTGAGTSWVMGHECQAAPCKTHNNFNTSDSTTFNNTGTDFELHYGSGNVTGKIASDTFSLAGFTIATTFGIALNASTDFSNFPIDGILGLAQGKGDHDTFVETLAKAKILSANRFGVSISRSSDGPNVGVINFGTLDTTRYTGDLTYIPIAADKKEDGEWAIPMDDISYNGQSIGIQAKVAYVDTGTSYVFANKDEVKRLHDKVPGATSDDGVTWRVPCTTTTDIALTFGGKTYTIAARDWVGPNVKDVCTSNIYGYDVVENAWLLGDTFLKNVYAVFDFDTYQIGLGSRPPPPLVTTTSSGVPTSSPTTALSPSDSGPSGTGTVNAANQSNTVPAEATATATDANGVPVPGATHPPGTGSHETPSTAATAEAIESVATPAPSSIKNTQSNATRNRTNAVSFTLVMSVFLALIS